MKSKTSRFILLAVAGTFIGALLGIGLFIIYGPSSKKTPVPVEFRTQAEEQDETRPETKPGPPETPTVKPGPPGSSVVKYEPQGAQAVDSEPPDPPAAASEDREATAMETDPPETPPQNPDPRMIDDRYRYIGLVTPRSGSLTPKGDSMVRGAEMAIKHFNAGLTPDQRPFRLIVEDEVQRFSPRNRLANDPRVRIIVGYVTERSLAESRPLYIDAGKPVLLPVLSGTDIPTLGDSIFFQLMSSDEEQARFLADYAARNMKDGSVLVIHEDSSFGLMLSGAFTRVFGGEYQREVKDMVYPGNSDELVDFAAQIVAAAPDVIFLALHAKEALGVVYALDKAGYKSSVLGTHALAFDYAISILDRLTEKAFLTLPFSHDTPDEIARAVIKEYEDHYQRRMDWLSVLTYDAVLLAMQAVTQGRNQVPDIIAYLAQTDGNPRKFQGIAGEYYFDQYGRSQGPIYLLEVKPDLLGRVP